MRNFWSIVSSIVRNHRIVLSDGKFVTVFSKMLIVRSIVKRRNVHNFTIRSHKKVIGVLRSSCSYGHHAIYITTCSIQPGTARFVPKFFHSHKAGTMSIGEIILNQKHSFIHITVPVIIYISSTCHIPDHGIVTSIQFINVMNFPHWYG
ncbi:rh90 [macacine betaherpesvirus 3]|uniref:Rh90 n=1 Tax=Rhesus cytomegalovirus (strain 68-1) TaxID=47929 RepID=Q7TFP4_RHCM6|nr:rh90 [macacine betaherpesvirus 3]AAP50616.1 rh90 [macacine betaherpesvirus 3]